MVLLRHTKRVHQATCSLSIVLDHITLTSCPNNPRAPRLWPRGSLSCAVAMDMMVVASLSFSRGPPAGIQSFNNYAGILLFAPACVCLWECASVRRQAWTFGSWRLSRACAYQNTSASRAPGTDATTTNRPLSLSQHIDLTSHRHFWHRGPHAKDVDAVRLHPTWWFCCFIWIISCSSTNY